MSCKKKPSIELGLTSWRLMERLKSELIFTYNIGAGSKNLQVPNQITFNTCLHKNCKTLVRKTNEKTEFRVSVYLLKLGVKTEKRWPHQVTFGTMPKGRSCEVTLCKENTRKSTKQMKATTFESSVAA